MQRIGWLTDEPGQPGLGARGLRFIVMGWYVPGRNVRALRRRKVWGTVLPARPRPSSAQHFQSADWSSRPSVCKSPLSHCLRTEVASAGLTCPGGVRSFSAPASHTHGAQPDTQPLLPPMPPPAGTDESRRTVRRPLTSRPHQREQYHRQQEHRRLRWGIKALLPLQAGSGPLHSLRARGLGPDEKTPGFGAGRGGRVCGDTVLSWQRPFLIVWSVSHQLQARAQERRVPDG